MEFLIGSRTERPGDDPIFALAAEAKARAQAGEAIVDATIGAILDDEGKLAILPTVSQVMRDLDPRVVAAYAPISGTPDYLSAVVDDLLGGTSAVEAAVAVATPGGSGALRHSIANFLEPGQSLLTSSFYWGPYKTLADEADRTLSTFRMFDETGRFDLADLERKLHATMEAQGRALVFLNSPCHNPTGYSLDDEEWRGISAIVRREAERGPISILVDVAYARYGTTGLSGCLDALLDLAGRAMILFAWSGSKAFTQYGSRIGALVAVSPDAEERRRVKNALGYSCRGTWSNCNAAGMATVAKILQTPELRAAVDRERAALKGMLDRRVQRWNEVAGPLGLRYPRYMGGFFTTVFCDDPAAAALQLKADGIFVVPLGGALRVGLSSVAERDVERLALGIAKALS